MFNSFTDSLPSRASKKECSFNYHTHSKSIAMGLASIWSADHFRQLSNYRISTEEYYTEFYTSDSFIFVRHVMRTAVNANFYRAKTTLMTHDKNEWILYNKGGTLLARVQKITTEFRIGTHFTKLRFTSTEYLNFLLLFFRVTESRKFYGIFHRCSKNL